VFFHGLSWEEKHGFMKKIFHYLLSAFLLFAGAGVAQAQPAPVSATLQRNNIKAVVQSNGALFTDFSQGQFIVPYQAGQPEITALRSAGLWLGGLDPAGNLSIAAQLYNEDGRADFAPGIHPDFASGLPELNKIWRVTSAQINAHRADWADNGVIDNPIQEIFAWPGGGSSSFDLYNPGLALPLTSQQYAEYWDQNGTGHYDPEGGDFPTVIVRGCHDENTTILPDEILWFTFHDAIPHTQTGGNRLNVEVQTAIFAYGCQNSDHPLNNTVFVRYKIVNRNNEPLHDLYFGLFNHIELGNPNDDFMGCDPERGLIFAYNGDTEDEGYYGANIPVLMANLLRGPLDETIQNVPIRAIFPFGGNENTPASPIEYYRLLSGQNTDGSPVDNNGFPYPGDPNDPNAVSEITTGNTPGNRMIMSSYGPFQLQHGAVNEIIIAYSFVQNPGATPLENVTAMYAQSDLLENYFNACFHQMETGCASLVSADTEPDTAPFDMKIMPNPASNEVWVQFSGSESQRLEMYDATGRKVSEMFREAGASEWRLPVGQLPAGMYWIKAQGRDGSFVAKSLVVSR